ncbi:MAG: hypothetical protein FJZ87_01165 [Chloroflexi bacterium]|nr:hypothetical protein [Chloroflexota bacterium]
MGSEPSPILVGVVGPCGAGKSTLIEGLSNRGYRCRHIAQEHSYVKHMWQVISKPDLLLFLQCSFETASLRRKLNWLPADFEEQQRRLSHAREHANVIIETDGMTIDQVLRRALDFLENNKP